MSRASIDARGNCACADDKERLHLAAMSRADAEHGIRRRVQTAYLGNNTALTRILGYHKFFVDTKDAGFGAHVLLDGYWEIWLTLFCSRNVLPGMVAIDVGANMGYYTVLFASLVGSTGHVLAVEPNPAAAALLCRSVDLNGYSRTTRIEMVACSDGSTSVAQLFVPATEPKNAHVIHGPSPNLDTVQTTCVTLDVLCDGYERVDFIKIDAEGSEERILAGMPVVLERYRPTIVVEVNVARYDDAKHFIRQLWNVYGQLHYVGYDGHAVHISEEEILSRDVGQDWLVVLSPHTLS